MSSVSKIVIGNYYYICANIKNKEILLVVVNNLYSYYSVTTHTSQYLTFNAAYFADRTSFKHGQM